MPFHGRLEWKCITKHNRHVFEDLINEFFELNREHLVDFHGLVVDMHKFDHFTYNDGDREVSFDKMLFQCVFRKSRTGVPLIPGQWWSAPLD